MESEFKEEIQLEIPAHGGTRMNANGLWVDMSYCGLPNWKVIELAVMRSGRIVVMTEQDSLWFEANGKSPKGSFLTPWPPPWDAITTAVHSSFLERVLLQSPETGEGMKITSCVDDGKGAFVVHCVTASGEIWKHTIKTEEV